MTSSRPPHAARRARAGAALRFACALTLSLIVLSPGSARAQFTFGDQRVGTSSGTFLGIGVGARAVGLGGSFVAVANDPSAIYWNPGAAPAGGRNVMRAPGQRGLVRASIEQVIVADPDIIVTWDRNFFDRVGKDPLWAGIRAVRDGRVYLAPTAPYGWIDGPPSVNRLIGLKWLAGLFYPDRFKTDLREEARAFYRLFYHVKPSDAQLETLIEWSKGRAPSAPAPRH